MGVCAGSVVTADVCIVVRPPDCCVFLAGPLDRRQWTHLDVNVHTVSSLQFVLPCQVKFIQNPL